MQVPARSRSLVLIVALAFSLSSCLIRSDSKTESSGRQISEQTFSKVKPGHSEEYVLALLGEPSTKTPPELGTEVWKWEYSEVKKSGGSVFLVISADSTKETSGTVFVEFLEGVVVSTWRD